MNKINFELRDIETIDLTMGMGIKKVYPPIENLEVIPTKEQQVFNHENSYGYDNVTVEPIPDEYIIPDGTLPITENATYDVRRFARVSASVYPAPNLQDKEITINENGTHDITYDEGYDGLNQVSVTVDAIEDLSEELTDYENGLTRQGVTIDDITKALQNKAIGGGDDMVRYSTEETLIGTWLGKPLYRKVVAVNQEFKDMSKIFLTGLNIETIIHIGSFQTRTTETRYLYDQFYDSVGRKFSPQYYNNEYILFWSTENETYVATVWIEYTKKTD